MSTIVIVALDLDTELVPGRTKAQLRALAARPVPKDARPFTIADAEAGIAAREARKRAA